MIAGIQAKKDNALDELKDIKADIDQLYVDRNSKVLSYETQYNDLEKKAKSHEDMVCRFEQRLFDVKDKVLDKENNLKDIQSKYEKEKKKIDDELQAVKNLVGNTEDEYIKWEQKIAKAKVDKEEGNYQKKIERGKKWDIGFLEQVAKKKLKNKVDNIDKAGLRDVLDG